MTGLSDNISGADSFWSRPEGKKFGTLVSILLAGGFGWGLYKALPFLITLAQNTIIFGIESAVVVALFYVLVLDNSLRKMCVNFYKRLIQALYVLSFNVDPIGGLSVRMQEKKEQLQVARQQAGKLKGQSQIVADAITQNNSKIDSGLKKITLAKKTGDVAQANAEAILVGVAQNSNKELAEVQKRLDRAYEQTTAIIHKAELAVYVLSGVIQIKTVTFNAAKAGRSALKNAISVLLGDTDKDQIFDANLAWIDDYTSTAFGEMDAIMDLSKDALNSMDLQEGVYSQDAFNLLDERLNEANKKLDNDPRSQRLLQASTDPTILSGIASAPREAVPVGAGDSSGLGHFLTDNSKKSR
jgi:hypothetical protein